MGSAFFLNRVSALPLETKIKHKKPMNNIILQMVQFPAEWHSITNATGHLARNVNQEILASKYQIFWHGQ